MAIPLVATLAKAEGLREEAPARPGPPAAKKSPGDLPIISLFRRTMKPEISGQGRSPRNSVHSSRSAAYARPTLLLNPLLSKFWPQVTENK